MSCPSILLAISCLSFPLCYVLTFKCCPVCCCPSCLLSCLSVTPNLYCLRSSIQCSSGRIRIRSGTEIYVLDPDLDPDSNADPNPKLYQKKICKKEPYFLAEIRWLHDYTYLTFTSNGNNRCKVEKIYK